MGATFTRSDYAWYGSVAAVCLVILGFGLNGKLEYHGLAFGIGYYLPLSAIVWLVLGLALGAKRTRLERTGAFGAIYITFMLGGILSNAMLVREARVMGTALVEEVAPFVEAIQAGKTSDTGISATPKASGDMGAFEGFIRSFMVKLLAIRNDYLKEAEATGFNTLLDPERLAHDRNLAESDRILRAASSLPDVYQKKSEALIRTAIAEMESLDLADHVKRDIKVGFEDGLAKGATSRQAIWNYERETFREMEKIIAHLRKTQGHWGYQNNMLMFERQEDLDIYNAHLQVIGELVAAEEALQKGGMETFKQSVGNL